MSQGLLDRSRIVAAPGWSRWLVPPAALSVHLAIGQAYAWSVFKPPLESAMDLSGTQSALPFQLGIVMLGLSAAFGGTFVERNGPRWAMFVSLVCFSTGFLVAALGVATGQFWLVVLGYGGIGGVGLGIGYISPVSTLIKWFPDRPGMATGIAIMGFGGGALIAAPWSSWMLDSFGADSSGIATTLVVHGLAYAAFMSLGVLLIRVPAADWRPPGPPRTAATARRMITTANVSARNAVRTPQFWCLWVVLCLNVTAGIGILEKAAPMIIDFFADTATPVAAGAAAGFVALLSLTNMAGRFIWSSTSDVIGRKNVYRVYLGAGALLYLVIALAGSLSTPVFVLAAMGILSFYGGGFATVPAYLKDLFGTYQVGAIHGRLLTAWSVAGVLGPLIVNAVADSQEAAGRTGSDLYTLSLFVMIGLLLVGFVANELIRPVDSRHHEPAEGGQAPAEKSEKAEQTAKPEQTAKSEKGATR
ncbi:OFA family MFS transporter [Actinoalloteichus fjordicus]|uniref:Nitrate/nitrite transporter n=1 Tax=Actinoalloteichus fjordicus TaxID=1612552 RepID=A0AAC9PR84_9PSEU|nr:OFA family MFS transporter [Actinoalloteichus fjordicus]APU13687.1 nitrate/nitrite transporter [Actinoalloteichus fjordicus]